MEEPNLFTVAVTFFALIIIPAYGSHKNTPHGVSFNQQTRDLRSKWEKVYGLKQKFPPLNISTISDPAPHLQLCNKLNQKREDSEKYDENGNLPLWAQGEGLDRAVLPPWIRGYDDDNLPHTRFMQTELWKHQFPRNCSDPSLKFLLVEWAGIHGHGLGSAFHMFSNRLADAVASSRIIVPLRNTFVRANSSDCVGRKRGSLDCYFFPVTSPECEERAHSLYTEENSQTQDSVVLFLPANSRVILTRTTMRLDDLWNNTQSTIEVFGRLLTLTSRKMNYKISSSNEVSMTSMKIGWWHAQTIRFMLRWPTPYMCHIINKLRHQAFGNETAVHVVRSSIEQARIQKKAMEDPASADYKAFTLASQRTEPFPTLDSELWWQDDEPYMPRPIVSMHIRQGDKAREMKIFSLLSYMWHAERLRKHMPSLKYIWLSTEMQSVVEQSAEYKGWNFFYSKNLRQSSSISMESYTCMVGTQLITELSFANLVISSQCDSFVGALGSNWNRLINELRLTNGRLKAGIAAVNFGEH